MQTQARKLALLLLAISLPFLATYLFTYRPGGNAGWYPQCFMKKFTGWDCPGCGGLRAGHEMLHLHFGEAIRYNSLLFILSPFLIYLACTSAARELLGWKVTPRFTWRGWPILLLLLVVGFTIVRNLPWFK